MPGIIDAILFRIGAKDDSKKGTDSASRNLNVLKKAAIAATAAFTVFQGVKGLAGMIKKAIDAGDRIQKLSIQMGTTTEALSQLSHAAELSGIDIETVSRSMQRLQRNSVDAVRNGGRVAELFEQLGINADLFVKLRPEDQLEVVAETLSRMENETEKAALAMELMGRTGAQLLPMFEKGAAGIREMRQQADDLNLTLTRAEADALAAANDAMLKFDDAIQGVTRRIAIGLAPGIKFVSTVLSELVGVLFQSAKNLGAFAAAAVALLSGEFRVAAQIAKQAASDTVDAWKAAGKATVQAWEDMGKEAVKTGKKVKDANKEQLKSADSARAAATMIRGLAKEISILPEEQALATKTTVALTNVWGDMSIRAQTAAKSVNDATRAVKEFQTTTALTVAEPVPTAEGAVASRAGPRPFFFNPGLIGPAPGAPGFATGGVMPEDGLARLHRGERVVSQRTTIGDININFTGGFPTDPGEIQRLVRDVLMPEILTATERG